ncbi:5-formyltetrahydrofolate cyclo-ligase [Thalassotalea euphylliae]|uniref:5-formyltetrahydrofolate cyclo-ligase n=1 Tax=Thalassotalea euphylliae TaxID=1655234 RepID=UPI003636B5B4
MTKAFERTAIRESVRSIRNALSASEHVAASKGIVKNIMSNERFSAASAIAIYLTNDGELRTEKLIEKAWELKKTVALPVLHPFCKGHLLFLRYDRQSKMKTNKFGIAEPVLDVTKVVPINTIDIVFTPLVAFDWKAQRLGMGGGFYDRTLSRWYKSVAHTPSAKPYPIGLALDCQQVEEIPTESWDIPLPEIITPSQQIISDHFRNLI